VPEQAALSRPHSDRIFRPALQIAAVQAGVALIAGASWLLASGGAAQAAAALAGGCTPAVLNVYLALRLPQGDEVAPSVFLAAFYRAQVLKLGLATGLLALAVMAFQDQFLALITTLGAALAVHWLALLWAR